MNVYYSARFAPSTRVCALGASRIGEGKETIANEGDQRTLKFDSDDAEPGEIRLRRKRCRRLGLREGVKGCVSV